MLRQLQIEADFENPQSPIALAMPVRQDVNFDPPGYSDCSREKILVQWVLSGHLGVAKHDLDTDFIGHLKYLFPSAVEPYLFPRAFMESKYPSCRTGIARVISDYGLSKSASIWSWRSYAFS